MDIYKQDAHTDVTCNHEHTHTHTHRERGEEGEGVRKFGMISGSSLKYFVVSGPDLEQQYFDIVRIKGGKTV